MQGWMALSVVSLGMMAVGIVMSHERVVRLGAVVGFVAALLSLLPLG